VICSTRYGCIIQPSLPIAAATMRLWRSPALATGLPPTSRRAVVISFGGYVWPQQRALRAGNVWSGYARIGNSAADSGKALDVLAVLVDQAKARISQ